jgi:hypothetical protein
MAGQWQTATATHFSRRGEATRAQGFVPEFPEKETPEFPAVARIITNGLRKDGKDRVNLSCGQGSSLLSNQAAA